MWLKIFFLTIPQFVFCFNENVINISLDYFNYREVKYICLFTCDFNNVWSHSFAKRTFKQNIALSKVNMEENLDDFNAVGKCLQQRASPVGVLIDSNCHRFEEIVQFASINMKFDAMHKWFIIGDDVNIQYETTYENSSNTYYNETITEDFDKMPDTIKVLENLNTSVDSDIIICLEKEYFVYEFYEAFNFGKIQGGRLNINKIGSWNKTGLYLHVNLNGYKYYRRWNFQNWQMRMVVVMSKPPKRFNPEMILGEQINPDVAHVTRTSSMNLNVIAEIHNFKFNYTVTDRWVGSYSKGSAKVVSTSLYFRQQDISPVIRFMPDIYAKIDIVHPPLTSIETRYYYRIPTHGAGKFENQFLRPLTAGAWVCVLIVTILCSLALLLSAILEHRPMPGQYAVFSVLASFCQQFFEDSEDRRTRRSLVARKMAALITGLSCMLIYNYYTSSVVSWLLNGPPPSITSLEELLESPLELIYEDIGYTRSWLQTPSYYYNKRNAKVEDEMRQKKVFNKKNGAPLLIPVEEGIEMVKAGGYAYHTEVNTANLLISRKFTQSELCELGSLQSMEMTSLYPAVQKNSPYKEFLVWSLSRLVERGIVSCIQHRKSSASVSCEGSSPRALALGGAAPAFLLLVFGYLLAGVIMLLERFLHRCFGNKK